MAEQPVVDYCPTGYPQIMTDEMTATMEAGLNAGYNAGRVRDEITNTQIQQLRTDSSFRQRLRDAYDEAGVNLISPTMSSLDHNLSFQEGVRQDIARWQARFDALEWMEKVKDVEDARKVVERDHVGVIQNIQNGGLAINGEIQECEWLYNMGVRIVQLTYNSQNLVGTGCTERVDSGLSNHGVELVKKLNDLDIIIDLSHCGKATTLDAINVSDDQVAFTHTFCQSLSDHDRGKSNEEMRRLAERNGYMGILALPFFLSPQEANPPLDLFIDHVDHAVSILGTDNVGVGTDWGSFTPDLPEQLRPGLKRSFQSKGFREEHNLRMGEGYEEMQTYLNWQAIPRGLEDRGYSKEEVRGLIGENFLSLWDRISA